MQIASLSFNTTWVTIDLGFLISSTITLRKDILGEQTRKNNRPVENQDLPPFNSLSLLETSQELLKALAWIFNVFGMVVAAFLKLILPAI